jgi:putative ABC transport system permease protein
MSLLLQTYAVTRMNLKSLPERMWMSSSTVVAVALVVAVLLGFLSLANGFRQTLEGSGREDIAIVLRAGSQGEINSILSAEQVAIMSSAPGIARQGQTTLLSPELLVIVDGIKRSTGLKANISLRGIGTQGLRVRPDAKIIAGRLPAPGANEIIAGQSLAREFAGFDVGSTIRLNNVPWRVVGMFSAPGVAESELWADVNVLQSLFNRSNSVQTIRIKLTTPQALAELKRFVAADPRLKLDVTSEKSFLAQQASQTGDLIRFLGWPLGLLMAVGALAGALNTMYAAVSARTAEIATLRIIGYSGFAAFVGVLAESLLLSMLGAIIGVGLAWFFFDGLSTSTLGGGFTQIIFTFKLSPTLIGQALLLSIGVGALGGILPGLRAASTPLLQGVSA